MLNFPTISLCEQYVGKILCTLDVCSDLTCYGLLLVKGV